MSMQETMAQPRKQQARMRGQDIAEAIEQEIALGRLTSGSWLKQIDLEERYGASRIDVRHALDRLAQRGFVEHVINRGYRVHSLSPRTLEELVEIRALLEVTAAAAAAAHITEAGRERLHQAASRFAKAVSHGTVDEQESANHEFHQLLLEAAPNREMVKLVMELRWRERLGLKERRSSARLLARDQSEHFEMLACLRRRDLSAFSQLLRRHILGALEESR